MEVTNSSAILYDFLQVQGGAEAVTIDICKQFPKFDLVSAFVNQFHFPNAPIESERLKVLTSPTSVLGWQTIKACIAFEYRTAWLKQYDTLLFSGSNAPLAVKNSKAKRNIYYCHTPPRFVYDLKEHYMNTIPLWQKPLLLALIRFLQPRYEKAIRQMDVVFANSKNVQSRLKKYLNVDSEVLYPPCKTERFRWLGQGEYFLSTARLEEYKRVDLVVRAFMQMPNKKLVVTSGGSQFEKLKQLADTYDNISFTGWVSEQELSELVGNCIATIYIPKDEDFGMSPIESMGAGKPVIGVDEGGVRETVVPDKTGWLLPENPRVEDIVELVSFIEPDHALILKQTCEQESDKFGKDFFERIAAEI